MVAIMKMLLLTATAAASPIYQRDATALVDIITNQIAPQITLLGADINGFPASGLEGALKLDVDDDALITILDNATTAAQSAGPFSIVDTLHIVAALTPVATDVVNTRSDLSQKVADFNSIGRGTFVLTNLQIQNIRWTAFLSVLVSSAPLGEAQALQAIQNQITEAYANAISAYSSV